MESSNQAAAGSHGVLPPEVLFDILVRLPAEELCRLRVVCPPWRSLTLDPVFIKAHTQRHPAPLIVASFAGDDPEHVHVMDLSGHVVKRLPVPGNHTMLSSRLDLVCVANKDGSCFAINPATAAVSHLLEPEAPPESEDDEWDCYEHYSDSSGCVEYEHSEFAVGRVDSTGEYKVLRLASSCKTWEEHHDVYLVSSVLTINGVGGWRSTESPEFIADIGRDHSSVVVGKAIYFLWYDDHPWAAMQRISCFDLDAEKWTTHPGPNPEDDDGDDNIDHYASMICASTLAELKGYLVLVYTTVVGIPVWTCGF
ncbi:hypothetical protein ACP70R_046236 [Stipagrostis hirtigluma subsp. patula]